MTGKTSLIKWKTISAKSPRAADLYRLDARGRSELERFTWRVRTIR
jgi:hypothetical protein